MTEIFWLNKLSAVFSVTWKIIITILTAEGHIPKMACYIFFQVSDWNPQDCQKLGWFEQTPDDKSSVAQSHFYICQLADTASLIPFIMTNLL